MVIYFTGTGNSKFVAKAIAEKRNDEIVNANEYIKNGKSGFFTSEKPYVFVFPVYLSTSPAIFRKFIKSSTFEGNNNAYFVPTCVGAAGSVPNAMADVCKEITTLQFKGSRKVLMPQNYIVYFTMFDEARKEDCFKNALTTVDSICNAIASGESLDDAPASGIEYTATKLVEVWYNSCFAVTKKFRVTDACIGCGTCSERCPANSIEMKDGKPVWTKKVCIHCMSCINRCPQRAIEYGNLTVGKERYICPEYQNSSSWFSNTLTATK